MKTFLITLLASGLVMRHNLNWHRRILTFFIPGALIGALVLAEYIRYRVKDIS